MHRRVLTKDIKQDLRKQKDIIVFLMRRISIMKCQFLKEKYLNAVLRPDLLSMWGMEVEDDKKILEVYMEEKMSPTANKRMIKKNIERSSITR